MLVRRPSQSSIRRNSPREAVAEFPDIAEFKLQWAQMLRATGQDDEALTALLEVVTDDPSNGVAQLDLACPYPGFEIAFA